MHTAARCSAREQRRRVVRDSSPIVAISKYNSNNFSPDRKHRENVNKKLLGNNMSVNNEHVNLKNRIENTCQEQSDASEAKAAYTKEVWEVPKNILQTDDSDENEKLFAFNFDDYLISEQNMSIDCNTLNDAQFNLWGPVDEVLNISREWELEQNDVCTSYNKNNLSISSMKQTNIITETNAKITHKPSTVATNTMQKQIHNSRKKTITSMPTTAKTKPMQKLSVCNTLTSERYCDKDDAEHNNTNMCSVDYTESSCDASSTNTTIALQELKDKIHNARRRLHHLRKSEEVNEPLYKENKLSHQYLTFDNDEMTQSTCAVSSSSSSTSSSSEELYWSSEKTNLSNSDNNESKKDKMKNWKRICKHDTTKELDNDWFMMLGIEKDFLEKHKRTEKGKKSEGNLEEQFDIDKYVMQLLCDENSVDTEMHYKVKNAHIQEVYSENMTWCEQNNTNKSEQNATRKAKLYNKFDKNNDDVIISEIVAKYAKVLNKEVKSLSSFTLEGEIEANWPMFMNSATMLCGYSANEISELLKCSVDYINKIKEENSRHANTHDEQSAHTQKTGRSCDVTGINNNPNDKSVHEQKKEELELELEYQGLPKWGTTSTIQDNKTHGNKVESEMLNKLLYELKEARDVHVQKALVNKLLDHLPTVPDELSTELSRQRRLIEHLIEVQRESMRRVKNAEKNVSIMNAKLFPSSVSHVDNSALWNNNRKESAVADALYAELIEEKNEHADNIDRHDNSNNICSEVDLPGADTMNHAVKLRNGQPLPITLHTGGNSNTHTILSNQVMLLSEQEQQERERQKLQAQREEAEARYYLKELYRVSDDYKSLLEDEKEKRRAERRAFGELLNHQQTQLLAQHKQELRELVKERKMQKIQNDLLVQKILHLTQDKVEKVVGDSALQNRTEMGLMMKGAVDKIESHLTKSALASLKQRAEGSPYKRAPQRKVQIPRQQTKLHERTATQNASEQKEQKHLHKSYVDGNDDVSNIDDNSTAEKDQVKTKSASTKDKAKENDGSVNDAILLEEQEVDNKIDKETIDETQIDKEQQEKETDKQQSTKRSNAARQTHEMRIAKLKSVYIAPQSRKSKLHLTTLQKDRKTLSAKEKNENSEEQVEKESSEAIDEKLRINIQPHEPTMHFTSQETMTLDADGQINSFDRSIVSTEIHKTPESEKNKYEELFEKIELLQQNNITHARLEEVGEKLYNKFPSDKWSDINISKKGQVSAFIGQTVLLVTPRTTRHMTDKYNTAQTELVHTLSQEQEEYSNKNEVCINSSNRSNITSYQSQWQRYSQTISKIKELLHDIHREEAALDNQSAHNVHPTNTINYNALEKEENDNYDNHEHFMTEIMRMTTSNNVNDDFKESMCTAQKANNKHLLQKNCHESNDENKEDRKNLQSKPYKLEKTFSKVLESKREELYQARCELQEIQNAMLHDTTGTNLQTSTRQANYKHNFLINHSNFAARDKDADELISNIKSELVHTFVEDAKVKELTCTIMKCIKQELISKWLETNISTSKDETVKDVKSSVPFDNKEHSENNYRMYSVNNTSVHDHITVEKGAGKESLIEELVAHSLLDLVSRLLDQEKMHNNKGVKVNKDNEFAQCDSNITAKSKELKELHEEKHLEEKPKTNAEQEEEQQTNTSNEQKINNNTNAVVHKTASDIFARIDQLHSDDANTWKAKTHDEAHVNHTLSNDNSFFIVPGKKMFADDIYENVASESFKPLRPAWINDTVTDDENNNAISTDTNKNKVIKSRYAVHDRYEDKPCMLSRQLYFPSSGSDTNPITVQLIKHQNKIKALTANVNNNHDYKWWQEYNRRPPIQQQQHLQQEEEEHYLQEQSNTKELKSHTNKVSSKKEEYKFVKNDKEEREREEQELYDKNNNNYYKHTYPYAPMPPLQIFIDVGKLVNQEWSTSLSGLPLAAQKLDLEDEVQSHQLLIEGHVRNNTLQNESRRCSCNDVGETLDDVIVEKIEEVFEPNVEERNIPALTTTTIPSTIIEEKQEKGNWQVEDKKGETPHKTEQSWNNVFMSQCIVNKHRQQQQADHTKSQKEVITMEKEIQQRQEEQHYQQKEQHPEMLFTQNWEQINFEEVQSRFVLDQIAELEYSNLLSLHEMTLMSLSALPIVPERLNELQQNSQNKYSNREQLQKLQTAAELEQNEQKLTQQEKTRYCEYQNRKEHEKQTATNCHDTKTCKSSTQMTILPPRDPILHFVFQWLKEAGETETNKQFDHSKLVNENEDNKSKQTNEVNVTSEKINEQGNTVNNERTQNQEHEREYNKNSTPIHPFLAGLRRADRLANTFETQSDQSSLPIAHESTPTESTTSSSSMTTLEESSYESSSQSMPGVNAIHGKERKMHNGCSTTNNNNKQVNINTNVPSSQSFEEELNEVQYNKLFPTLTSDLTEITSTCVSTPFYKQHKNKYNTFAKNNKSKYNATSRKSRAAPVISLSSTEKATSYGNNTDLITTSDSDKKENSKENEKECPIQSSVSLMLKRSESSDTTRYTSTSRSLSVPDELEFSNNRNSSNDGDDDNVYISANIKDNVFETHSYLDVNDSNRNNYDDTYDDSYDGDTTSYNSNTRYTSTTRATTESDCYNEVGSEWHYRNATNKHHVRNLHMLPITLISPALNDHDDDNLDDKNKIDNYSNVDVGSNDVRNKKIDNVSVMMPQANKTNTQITSQQPSLPQEATSSRSWW